jgi:hypothetical protein
MNFAPRSFRQLERLVSPQLKSSKGKPVIPEMFLAISIDATAASSPDDFRLR